MCSDPFLRDLHRSERGTTTVDLRNSREAKLPGFEARVSAVLYFRLNTQSCNNVPAIPQKTWAKNPLEYRTFFSLQSSLQRPQRLHARTGIPLSPLATS